MDGSFSLSLGFNISTINNNKKEYKHQKRDGVDVELG